MAIKKGEYVSDHYWVEVRFNPFNPVKKPYIVRTNDNAVVDGFKTLREAIEYVQEKEKEYGNTRSN